MSKRKNTEGVLELFVAAVKRVIPTESLPNHCTDHEDLACELVIELSGSVCMVEKHEFDKMVQQLRQLRRYEEAITKGMLYSPLDKFQPYVIPDPFKN